MKILASLLPLALAMAPAEDPCKDLKMTPPSPDDDTLEFSLEQDGIEGCASCAAQMDLKVGEDGLINEQARLSDSTAATTHGCANDGVLCLTPQGKPLLPHRMPDQLRPGDELQIKIIGCEALNEGINFSVDAKRITSADRLFRNDFTKKAAADTPSGEAGALANVPCTRERLCRSSGTIGVLHETSVTIPRDDGLQRLDVQLSSDVTPKATYKNLTPSKGSVSIPIVQGRYFIDLGVLVPFVIEGRRRVVADQGPASGTRILAIDHDMPKPTPAVMLNVFPGGRGAGIFHAFAERQRCNRASASYFGCRRRNHARNTANALGFQVGLDLDFTDPADAFFAGGVFEPVTGLSINAGFSVRKGQFLGPGRREGQLVADDEDLGAQDRYMVRPYVGITLSLDIIRAVIAFGGKARGVDTGGN